MRGEKEKIGGKQAEERECVGARLRRGWPFLLCYAVTIVGAIVGAVGEVNRVSKTNGR